MAKGRGLDARLRAGPPLVLDGGMGTRLLARGMPRGEPTAAQVLRRPELVRAAHAEDVAAGAEAVHACTFLAHRAGLAGSALEDRVAEVAARAVALARDAGARWVLGDVGPTGLAGDARSRALGELVEALAAAGVDAVHVETATSVAEAAEAVRIALRAGIPAWASAAFVRGRTLAGETPAEFARAMADAGAAAVGANCALEAREMAALAPELRGAGLPVVLQPNVEPGRDAPPGPFARALLAAGARAVGGCCGTDARHVAALRAAVDARWGRGG